MNVELGDEYDWEDQVRDEDECHFGYGACIDTSCRDCESCIGCELQRVEPQEEEKGSP